MIDMKRKYQTRDGRNVRLLCTDAPGDYPVRGLVEKEDSTYSWTLDGLEYTGKTFHWDLIEVPNTKQLTFYRRKWCLNIDFGEVHTNFALQRSKDEFDAQYNVADGCFVWSDEWETIVVEVPCEV